jgi:hypothetical protein
VRVRTILFSALLGIEIACCSITVPAHADGIDISFGFPTTSIREFQQNANSILFPKKFVKISRIQSWSRPYSNEINFVGRDLKNLLGTKLPRLVSNIACFVISVANLHKSIDAYVMANPLAIISNLDIPVNLTFGTKSRRFKFENPNEWPLVGFHREQLASHRIPLEQRGEERQYSDPRNDSGPNHQLASDRREPSSFPYERVFVGICVIGLGSICLWFSFESFEKGAKSPRYIAGGVVLGLIAFALIGHGLFYASLGVWGLPSVYVL